MNTFRKKVDAIGLALPLPNINPNVVSGLSVITSMFFVLSLNLHLLFPLIFLLITILLDWFDGLIAKKFGRVSEEGYFVDIVSDRLSEGIMFSIFFFPWFYLFTLNCLLTMKSATGKKHVVLPLRHIFVIYVIWLILA